jgi:hypothetical protein
MSYWKLKRINIEVEPTSTAHATLWWFLFGTNPYHITPAVFGEVMWCLPKPFQPSFFGEANFSRVGGVIGRSKC